MTRHLRPGSCAIAVTLAVLGCNQSHSVAPPHGGDGDSDGGGDALAIAFTGFNNGVRLSGGSFPAGTDTTEDLHRVVDVTESTNNPAFTVSTGVIARLNSATTSGAYAMIPVKNVGDRAYCFVTVAHVHYFGLGDVVLGEASMRDVIGSVGRDNSVFTATCLAPQETGYFCDVILGDVYESISRIEVELGEDSDTRLHDPEAHLTPVSYNYDPLIGLTLTFTNDGTRPARLMDGMSVYLLLDGDGTPLWFHTFDTPASPADLLVPATGAATLFDPDVSYNATVSRILVLFDFADD